MKIKVRKTPKYVKLKPEQIAKCQGKEEKENNEVPAMKIGPGQPDKDPKTRIVKKTGPRIKMNKGEGHGS